MASGPPVPGDVVQSLLQSFTPQQLSAIAQLAAATSNNASDTKQIAIPEQSRSAKRRAFALKHKESMSKRPLNSFMAYRS